MTLRVLVERREHNRQDNLDIVADEIAEILVVPEVEGSLGNLKVRARNGLCELVEQWLLYLGELSRIHHLKDVLNLVKEHNFFSAVDLGPIAQQTEDDLRINISNQTSMGSKRI